MVDEGLLYSVGKFPFYSEKNSPGITQLIPPRREGFFVKWISDRLTIDQVVVIVVSFFVLKDRSRHLVQKPEVDFDTRLPADQIIVLLCPTIAICK